MKTNCPATKRFAFVSKFHVNALDNFPKALGVLWIEDYVRLSNSLGPSDTVTNGTCTVSSADRAASMGGSLKPSSTTPPGRQLLDTGQNANKRHLGRTEQKLMRLEKNW